MNAHRQPQHLNQVSFPRMNNQLSCQEAANQFFSGVTNQCQMPMSFINEPGPVTTDAITTFLQKVCAPNENQCLQTIGPAMGTLMQSCAADKNSQITVGSKKYNTEQLMSLAMELVQSSSTCMHTDNQKVIFSISYCSLPF
jgi:hypothetical protein